MGKLYTLIKYGVSTSWQKITIFLSAQHDTYYLFISLFLKIQRKLCGWLLLGCFDAMLVGPDGKSFDGSSTRGGPRGRQTNCRPQWDGRGGALLGVRGARSRPTAAPSPHTLCRAGRGPPLGRAPPAIFLVSGLHPLFFLLPASSPFRPQHAVPTPCRQPPTASAGLALPRALISYRSAGAAGRGPAGEAHPGIPHRRCRGTGLFALLRSASVPSPLA